jgi:hypothetical protein
MTQHNKLKEFFESNPNKWIPVYELPKFALQYNARILELRRAGMEIKNKWEIVDGIKHSFYMYIPKRPAFMEQSGQLCFIGG